MGQGERLQDRADPEPDIDVSGAKAPKDRALGELIDRVREGKSDGVVIAKLDRFGRDERR